MLANTVAILEKWLKRVCDIDMASNSSHSPFLLAYAPLMG
jgi:hypothetical protein